MTLWRYTNLFIIIIIIIIIIIDVKNGTSETVFWPNRPPVEKQA